MLHDSASTLVEFWIEAHDDGGVTLRVAESGFGLPITRQAVARHIDVLRQSGLVEAEHHGREVRYRAIGSRISALARDLDAIARSWDARLRKIKDLAEQDPA